MTWSPAAPHLSVAATVGNACELDSAEGVELADRHLAGVRTTGLDLPRAEIVDVRLDDCDIAGFNARDASMRRLHVERSRLRGVYVTGSHLQDIVLDDCPTEQISLRMSTLQRCVFRNCRLVGADLYGATFDRVLFEDCDLTQAVFTHAKVTELRLQRCELLGIDGVESLAGAEIDLADLPSIAPALARAVGLRVHAEDDLV